MGQRHSLIFSFVQFHFLESFITTRTYKEKFDHIPSSLHTIYQIMRRTIVIQIHLLLALSSSPPTFGFATALSRQRNQLPARTHRTDTQHNKEKSAVAIFSQAPSITDNGADKGADKGDGTATMSNEIFNLVKSIVGAGVLSLPAGIAAFGNAPSALIPASLLILAMGVISAYTFSLIARVCALTGASSYADAWDKTRGTSTSWIIAASSALVCFSGNLTYSMVLADTFKSILATIGILVPRTTVLAVLTTTILLPLCLVKNLSSLAPFSVVGLMGMAYTGIAIAIRFFGGSYAAPAGKFLLDLPANMQPAFGTIGARGVLSPKSLIFVSMLSTAYIGHFNAPKFFKELKNNTLERFNILTTASFGISIAFYAAVSAMAFLTFGSSTAGLVLNNYSTNDVLISSSRLAVAVSLIFSYPLLFVGTRDGVLDLARVSESKRTNGLLNKVTVGILGLISLLATKITDLTFVVSISGAVLGSSLIFIFPTLMFRAAVRKDPSKKWEKRLCSVIASMGVAIGMVGTNMALQSL
jgi:amino acid permease